MIQTEWQNDTWEDSLAITRMCALLQVADLTNNEWQYVSTDLGEVTVSSWVMLPEQEDR